MDTSHLHSKHSLIFIFTVRMLIFYFVCNFIHIHAVDYYSLCFQRVHNNTETIQIYRVKVFTDFPSILMTINVLNIARSEIILLHKWITAHGRGDEIVMKHLPFKNWLTFFLCSIVGASIITKKIFRNHFLAVFFKDICIYYTMFLMMQFINRHTYIQLK